MDLLLSWRTAVSSQWSGKNDEDENWGKQIEKMKDGVKTKKGFHHSGRKKPSEDG